LKGPKGSLEYQLKISVTIESKIFPQQVEWTELNKLELVAFHNAGTIINYLEEVDLLEGLQVGNSIRVTFKVVQGRSFHIRGLAFCHSFDPIESFT